MTVTRKTKKLVFLFHVDGDDSEVVVCDSQYCALAAASEYMLENSHSMTAEDVETMEELLSDGDIKKAVSLWGSWSGDTEFLRVEEKELFTADTTIDELAEAIGEKSR